MPLTFLDPGQLTARLELEEPVETADGQGGAAVSFTPVGAVWARIEPVAAEMVETGHVERQAVTHRIWMRHSPAVAPGMRLRKGTRIFLIRTVHDPDERGRYLVARVMEER